jgi:hypothetical protein
MDLSYIPEKYSLDGQRASRILNEGLKKWLMTIEEFESRAAVQDNPPPQSPRKKKYRSSRK